MPVRSDTLFWHAYIVYVSVWHHSLVACKFCSQVARPASAALRLVDPVACGNWHIRRNAETFSVCVCWHQMAVDTKSQQTVANKDAVDSVVFYALCKAHRVIFFIFMSWNPISCSSFFLLCISAAWQRAYRIWNGRAKSHGTKRSTNDGSGKELHSSGGHPPSATTGGGHFQMV